MKKSEYANVNKRKKMQGMQRNGETSSERCLGTALMTFGGLLTYAGGCSIAAVAAITAALTI